MPGNKNSEPFNELPCPTIFKPSKNKDVAANDSPKTLKTLAITSGKPLGNIKEPATPKRVINSNGLKNNDLMVFKIIKDLSFKQRLRLAICSAEQVSGHKGGF